LVKRVQWRVVAGVLLIAAGLLFLLQTFGIVRFVWDVIWTGLFAAGGVCFLWVFLERREQWWAAIPGMVLLGIGAQIGLSILGLDGLLGGAIFLGALSVAFWLVYLRSRENWWAVIPGGVLLSLAVVAGVDEIAPRAETGGLFFLGLALTFALVYLLPTPGVRMNWALIPAGVLCAIGLIVTIATSSVLSFLWPAALIVVGCFLVYRALRD
jgi:hypothetical protein